MTHIELRAPMNLRAAAVGVLPTRFDGVAYSGGIVPGTKAALGPRSH